jgi:hypothetical protein
MLRAPDALELSVVCSARVTPGVLRIVHGCSKTTRQVGGIADTVNAGDHTRID